ncbi:MAG: hypothetical protein ACOYT8_03095 [Candidatus Dependentiae bacterium]
MWFYVNARDIIEISFYFMIIYRLSLWLAKDNSNLIFWFWGYSCSLLVAYLINIPTTILFLVFLWPLFITLLFIVHQETIQKNFIALAKIPQQINNKNWLNILIKESLITTHRNKQVLCIIETNFNIHSYIENPLPVHSLITPDLITLITHSEFYNQNKFILIDQEGYLRGINVTIPSIANTLSLGENKNSIEHFTTFSFKLKNLIVRASSSTHTFDMVIEGKIYLKMTALQTQELLQTYFSSINQQKDRGIETYANNQKPHNTQIEH